MTDTDKVIQKLEQRYKNVDVPRGQVSAMICGGLANGMTLGQAEIAFRLAISEIYNLQEYFTVYDVAEITGQSISEVLQAVENSRVDLFESGIDPDTYFPPISNNIYQN